MDFKKLLYSKSLLIALLVSWIVSSVLMIFMLSNLNMIVHGTLYEYGLQFSTLWAEPYWRYLDLIFLCLGLASGFGFCAIALGFYTSRKAMVASSVVSEKIQVSKTSKLGYANGKKQPSEPKAKNGKGKTVISCPNCNKPVSRPLVMLNFEGGKTRLVNVCPYCNHRLEKVKDEATSEPQFHVRNQNSIQKEIKD